MFAHRAFVELYKKHPAGYTLRMPAPTQTKPGMLAISPVVRMKIQRVVDRAGKSGASRELNIPIQTIRRVIAGEHARTSTAVMIETRMREWEEKVEKPARPAPDSR